MDATALAQLQDFARMIEVMASIDRKLSLYGLEYMQVVLLAQAHGWVTIVEKADHWTVSKYRTLGTAVVVAHNRLPEAEAMAVRLTAQGQIVLQRCWLLFREFTLTPSTTT